MGRRKIDIQPLTNERNRLVTFQKRKNGLFKKAYELGVLCSVDVAVIIFTPGQDNKLFEFCSGNIDEMVLRRLNYEGERDLRTTIDFTNGGGQLKGGSSSAAAGIAESEDDDDDDEISDTKPSKRKACGTRSRPVRGAPPAIDKLPVYRTDSPQTLASSAESLPRSSAFSMSDRSGPLLDRSRSDEYDHPTAARQGNTIPRRGSSSSNPDYRRISHFSLLRGGLKSDWPSPRLDNGAQHQPNGGPLSSSALLGLDAHAHHSGHHQELLSNFARHRANALAHSASAGGPGISRRLPVPYSMATPPLPPTSLAGGNGGCTSGSNGSNGGGGGGGSGDDSWLDFLAMPSTTMSLSLLADHPTALGGPHTSSAYDFPFGLGLGGTGRGSGGSGLGLGSYGLPDGADLDKERELLVREGGNDFGPRKRPRWE